MTSSFRKKWINTLFWFYSIVIPFGLLMWLVNGTCPWKLLLISLSQWVYFFIEKQIAKDYGRNS